MIKILREADKVPIAEVARKHGVSEQMLYVWRNPSLIPTYERRLQTLEPQRAALQEKLEAGPAPALDFESSFRTVLRFVANSLIFWRSESPSLKRTALKAAFTDKLAYIPKEGFRTIPKALPFELLERVGAGDYEMVEVAGVEPASEGA